MGSLGPLTAPTVVRLASILQSGMACLLGPVEGLLEMQTETGKGLAPSPSQLVRILSSKGPIGMELGTRSVGI